MVYRLNLFKLLFSMEDHLYRIRKAEKLERMWKVSGLLLLLSIGLYIWMGYLGIGSDVFLINSLSSTSLEYESSKFWFIIGRACFGIIYPALILFIPSLLFKLLTKIPYRKLVIMQQIVLLVLLMERFIWVLFILFAGLDWYVSPVSFGIIASYLTDKSLIIYFFGVISVFQLWIIWFQVRFISNLTSMRKRWVWFIVIMMHIVFWWMVALLAVMDIQIISGWFE